MAATTRVAPVDLRWVTNTGHSERRQQRTRPQWLDPGPGKHVALTENGGHADASGAKHLHRRNDCQAGTLKAGAANAFSATSATTVDTGATLDLGGINQTVSSLSGGGAVTNLRVERRDLTNQGASSTFSGVIQNGGWTNTTGLTKIRRETR